VVEHLSAREKQILQTLTEDPSTPSQELAKRFGVSVVTIRTDLKNLAARGVITRTHGGALPAFHKSITNRQAVRSEEKHRIAKAAADLVQEGDTIMIVAGTTTALIAKYLLGKGNIHIVTDSTLILPYVRANPALNLTVVGGEFRGSSESFVGPQALEAVERFNCKMAFLGTDGFSLERGLTTHLIEGAEMVKVMAAHADKSILLADSSKYGRSGFVSIMPLKTMDTLISDTEFDPVVAAQLRSEGIEVLLV